MPKLWRLHGLEVGENKDPVDLLLYFSLRLFEIDLMRSSESLACLRLKQV